MPDNSPKKPEAEAIPVQPENKAAVENAPEPVAAEPEVKNKKANTEEENKKKANEEAAEAAATQKKFQANQLDAKSKSAGKKDDKDEEKKDAKADQKKDPLGFLYRKSKEQDDPLQKLWDELNNFVLKNHGAFQGFAMQKAGELMQKAGEYGKEAKNQFADGLINMGQWLKSEAKKTEPNEEAKKSSLPSFMSKMDDGATLKAPGMEEKPAPANDELGGEMKPAPVEDELGGEMKPVSLSDEEEQAEESTSNKI